MEISPLSFTDDVEDSTVLSFIHEYCEFSENRVYIMSAIARPKENPELSNSVVFREIITDKQDIARRYNRLKVLAEYYEAPDADGELSFRLYLKVNARDVAKAFHKFQAELLSINQAISSGHSESWRRVQRLDKEWKSMLEADGNKVDKRFVIDIDVDDEQVFESVYEALLDETEVITAIQTPNGYHIITEPFNYTEFDSYTENDNIELGTDKMTFLGWLS